MKKEILDEINRLLKQLEQDPHLPSNKEVDEGVREVLEHLKGFVRNRRENGKCDFLGAPKIVSGDLEEAARNYPSAIHVVSPQWSGEVRAAFVAGAEWQKEQDEKEQADLFTIVALDAAQRAKEQMLKDAVEGEIGYWNQTGLSILLDKSLEKLGYDEDIKVKIIIIKDKEDEE